MANDAPRYVSRVAVAVVGGVALLVLAAALADLGPWLGAADVAEAEGLDADAGGGSARATLAAPDATREAVDGNERDGLVHGAVREAATGDGVPEVAVVATVYGKEQGRVRTDADGLYAIEFWVPDSPSEHVFAAVRVEVPGGWVVEGRLERVLEYPALTDGLEVYFALRPVEPLRIRAFDGRTGEPADEVVLDVARDGAPVPLARVGVGEWATPRDTASGDFEVAARGGWVSRPAPGAAGRAAPEANLLERLQVRVDPETDDAVLDVQVHPTLRLAFPDADVSEEPWIRVFVTDRPGQSEDGRPWWERSVRADPDGLFAVPAPPGELAWRVEVEIASGMRQFTTGAQPRFGVSPWREPTIAPVVAVPLAVVDVARLTVFPVGETAERVAEAGLVARIARTPGEATPRVGSPWRRDPGLFPGGRRRVGGRDPVDGLTWDRAPVGRYAVEVGAPGFAPRIVEVEVRAEGRNEIDVALEPLPAGARLAGAVSGIPVSPDRSGWLLTIERVGEARFSQVGATPRSFGTNGLVADRLRLQQGFGYLERDPFESPPLEPGEYVLRLEQELNRLRVPDALGLELRRRYRTPGFSTGPGSSSTRGQQRYALPVLPLERVVVAEWRVRAPATDLVLRVPSPAPALEAFLRWDR